MGDVTKSIMQLPTRLRSTRRFRKGISQPEGESAERQGSTVGDKYPILMSAIIAPNAFNGGKGRRRVRGGRKRRTRSIVP